MTLAAVTPKVKKNASRVDISSVQEFLPCETPDSWVEAALANQTIMLIDHANCEKKAASTAMTLLYRYFDRAKRDNLCSNSGRSKQLLRQ